MSSRVTTLGNVAINDLIDLGLRMPDGSTELFEVVNKHEDYVTLMTKNIIDFMPFNAIENKHSDNANSYAESSIRKYLAELYQSVAKENKLLEAYTVGNKEFFLPTTNTLGFGEGKGWEAFKDDASRVKYPGEYAATKVEAYGPGKADWYWTSTPHATYAYGVRLVYTDGTLSNYIAYYGSNGAAPALNLKPSTKVIRIDGVWHFYEKFSQGSTSVSGEIKVGDWVEVIEVDEKDERKGIEVGDVYKVEGIALTGGKDVVIVTRNNKNSDALYLNQIKKVSSPKTQSPKLKDVPKAINSAVSKFEMLARSYTENLSETLVAKNADYGNSFEKSYEKHGLVSAVIRLEDKLNRLESLIKNEAQVNESIDDTLLDIAGYAILTLIARGDNHDNR